MLKLAHPTSQEIKCGIGMQALVVLGGRFPVRLVLICFESEILQSRWCHMVGIDLLREKRSTSWWMKSEVSKTEGRRIGHVRSDSEGRRIGQQCGSAAIWIKDVPC